jgi:hypothetical protein
MCTLRESNPYGAVYNVSPRPDKNPTLSLAAGKVSAGLPRRQGQAAPRWPPASLDSSCAQRNRQLREEQGENRPTPKETGF